MTVPEVYTSSICEQIKENTRLLNKLTRKFDPNSYTAEIQWKYIQKVEQKIDGLAELYEKIEAEYA